MIKERDEVIENEGYIEEYLNDDELRLQIIEQYQEVLLEDKQRTQKL